LRALVAIVGAAAINAAQGMALNAVIQPDIVNPVTSDG
jgi:hypothetical protein